MQKVILVTGGSRGIGAATCHHAATAGYTVAVNFHSDAEAADTLVLALREKGVSAAAFQADVGVEADVVKLFSRVIETFGSLDALVNSAGIAGTYMEVIDYDAAMLQALMQTNVIGTMLCCREATRFMSNAQGGKGGAIVNVSSMAGTIGGRPGDSAYAASKAAVDAFTAGFAKEVGAQGIRVNTVRPGVTLTDMTNSVQDNQEIRTAIEGSIAMQRVASAEEIASPIMWLLSEEASFISGAHLNASGGGFLISGSTKKA